MRLYCADYVPNSENATVVSCTYSIFCTKEKITHRFITKLHRQRKYEANILRKVGLLILRKN